VRHAPSVDDFLADPVGAHVRGRAFAAWMPTDRLAGASHFGAFEAADLPAMRALFDLVLHPALVVPYDLVHDLGGVDRLDLPAFEFLAAFLAAWMPKLAGGLRRLAVVRPPGLAGAAFTGLFHDFGAKFDAELFTSRDEALRWLGVDDPVRRELLAVAEAFEHAPPLLRRLRDALAAHADLTLDDAARALGESSRSLQRHLAEERTSFRGELAGARIRVAKRRLVETDDKIEIIARDLGFRSVAAFTTMFGKLAGEPPDAFRKRGRGRSG
jgi:AraC-like DNA-binding protein